MALYALTIFTGAFLLFQVQPLIGKYILPWFGGGPGVWTTCMLFFQVLLLGGYAYAHVISSRLKPRAQVIVHLVLVAGALALLPIIPADSWKPLGGGNPAAQILVLLAACLGLPYFVLSSTGPLLQQWFSRANPGKSPYRLYALSNAGSLLALVSYPFYFEPHFTRHAQANLWGWGLAAYAVCCALCARKLWRLEAESPGGAGQGPAGVFPTPNPRPSTLTRLLWLLLPACASVLLLATTNKMCLDVAVIPFLWVLPLGLYLLSFIICFDSPRWYARFPFALALIAALGGLCWALMRGTEGSIYKLVGVYSGALFICCLVCHGELYRLRPDPRRLTGFYLMIAAGGALGGLFVAVVAPRLFTDFYELHWGVLLCGLLFFIACVRDRGTQTVVWASCPGPHGQDARATNLTCSQHVSKFKDSSGPAPLAPVGESAGRPETQVEGEPGAAAFSERGSSGWGAKLKLCGAVFFRFLASAFRPDAWPWLACALPVLAFGGLDRLIARLGSHATHVPQGYFIALRIGVWTVLGLLAVWAVWKGRRLPWPYWHALACVWLAVGWLALAVTLWTHGRKPAEEVVYKSRNFYGLLTVFEHRREEPNGRHLLLMHGRITHGLQFIAPQLSALPTTYYGPTSGVGLGIQALPAGSRRIGLVGLGTGTLTAYGRPGDYLRIYEINPQVKRLAGPWFKYLSRCPAKVDVVLGDARLSMEREPSQQFDLLALDAFSSDAIPVHLLTKEAFELYGRHLKTNGVLAVHISNHYLDLEPVVANLARRFNYQAALIDYDETDAEWWLYSSTWMLLTRNEAILRSPRIADGAYSLKDKKTKVPLWTDDFASLFQILK